MTTTKICKRCEVPKPITEFGPDKRAADRHSYECRPCRADLRRERRQARLEREHELVRQRYAADPEKFKHAAWVNRLKHRYGITIEQYEEMHAAQHGLCKLCGEPQQPKAGRLDVDHCHETGKVRGLLCRRCNMRLGHLNDLPWVKAALEYLGVQ